jgi:cysteine synthase A
MRFKVDELVGFSLVGQTPFARLEAPGGSQVWVKMEGSNPGGSIKDRAAWGMLRRAELAGQLKEGAVIVEPTSGNTGIALAMLGRGLGLRVILTMPSRCLRKGGRFLPLTGRNWSSPPRAKGWRARWPGPAHSLRKYRGPLCPDSSITPETHGLTRSRPGPRFSMP